MFKHHNFNHKRKEREGKTIKLGKKNFIFKNIAIPTEYNEEIDANEVVTPTSKNKKNYGKK